MRTHAVTRASFLDGVASQISTIEEVIARGLASDRQIQAQTYLDFLKSISTKYANIDHWKIRFPKYPDLNG
jgi:hypothetical protein